MVLQMRTRSMKRQKSEMVEDTEAAAKNDVKVKPRTKQPVSKEVKTAYPADKTGGRRKGKRTMGRPLGQGQAIASAVQDEVRIDPGMSADLGEAEKSAKSGREKETSSLEPAAEEELDRIQGIELTSVPTKRGMKRKANKEPPAQNEMLGDAQNEPDLKTVATEIDLKAKGLVTRGRKKKGDKAEESVAHDEDLKAGASVSTPEKAKPVKRGKKQKESSNGDEVLHTKMFAKRGRKNKIEDTPLRAEDKGTVETRAEPEASVKRLKEDQESPHPRGQNRLLKFEDSSGQAMKTRDPNRNVYDFLDSDDEVGVKRKATPKARRGRTQTLRSRRGGADMVTSKNNKKTTEPNLATDKVYGSLMEEQENHPQSENQKKFFKTKGGGQSKDDEIGHATTSREVGGADQHEVTANGEAENAEAGHAATIHGDAEDAGAMRGTNSGKARRGKKAARPDELESRKAKLSLRVAPSPGRGRLLRSGINKP